MRILVTGSTGQIGSHVVEAAAAADHEPLGLDQRPSEWTRIEGDIRDLPTCIGAMRGCDAVIHCAAQISVQGSINDPQLDTSTNVLGSVNLLEAARRSDLKRFVNISSAAVYGNPIGVPITEDHPIQPLSPYGAGKAATEGYVAMYGRLHGLSYVNIRPFNVYSRRQGANDPYSGVMSRFVARLHEGLPPVVFGDGTQRRDFVHAEDVARFLVQLAVTPSQFRTVNCGTGRGVGIRTLAEHFMAAAGMPRDGVLHAPRRAGDIQDSVAATERAKAAGFVPSISIEDGVAEMLLGRRPARAIVSSQAVREGA